MASLLHNLSIFLTFLLLRSSEAAPVQACLADPSCGPIPGQSNVYSDYKHASAPFPGNTTGAVLNTTSGPAAPDDLLFQNLLAAEWIIFSFYEQGVEYFDHQDFIDAGFASGTYDRIREIRNNEAGHLRIFQDQISSNSIKPGPCRYVFPFSTPENFLALQTLIEVSSMAFITGLELQAQTDLSKGALVAIGQTETRHNTWALMSAWNVDPFARPSDTYFPYANQVLEYTNTWVVNGSCPKENPEYPTPSQPLFSIIVDSTHTETIAPGSSLTLVQPEYAFVKGKEYYAVFFHGVGNITIPFNTSNYTTTIPSEFEAKGIIAMVVATEAGAVTAESVIAGPLFLLELPQRVGAQLIIV